MRTLVLDLETVPLAASMAAEYPEADRLPPGNYKNADAIASWREKDKAVWADSRAKECALTPRLGRIMCLGWATDEEMPNTLMARTEREEAALLGVAWDRISDADRLVTFNGGFDLRFILVRSMILGVNPQQTFGASDWFRRYSTSPHFDCRAVLTGWDDRQTGKLHEWCASFGIESNDSTSGADIFAFYQAGDFDSIAAHCRSDIRLTRDLYRRVGPIFTGNIAA